MQKLGAPSDRLKTVWQAARQNDPYADWWLIKIEEAIVLCRSRMNNVLEQFNTLMDSQRSLQVTIAESSKPQRIALQFANPYAFRAAQMLAEFDRLVCTVVTLRHVGVDIPNALSGQADSSGRWVRRVFALPQGYHFYDIDRAAVMQGTQRAIKAREVMGEVPEDVMRGEKQPSLRPKPLDVQHRVFSMGASRGTFQDGEKTVHNDDPPGDVNANTLPQN